jgi:hypothetical protein
MKMSNQVKAALIGAVALIVVGLLPWLIPHFFNQSPVPNPSTPTASTTLSPTISTTVTPQLSPTPTPPPKLITFPASFKAETDCRASNPFPSTTMYTCIETLMKSGQGSLSWAASSSGLAGIQFQPPEGILGPDQPSTKVYIFVQVRTLPPSACPTAASLIFTNETNPTNIVPSVSWSC